MFGFSRIRCLGEVLIRYLLIFWCFVFLVLDVCVYYLFGFFFKKKFDVCLLI